MGGSRRDQSEPDRVAPRPPDRAEPLSDYRIPSGRRGIPPTLVAENQRWRLLGAVGEVLAERGYAGLTGSAIVARAGVSKTTLYAHFDGIEACLLAAHGVAAECVWDLAASACTAESGQSSRLRGALDAVVGFLAAEPSLACLLSSEAAAGDAAVAASRRRLIGRLAELLRGDRGEGEDLPPPLAQRRLLDATFALLSDRLAAGAIEGLSDCASELAELLAGPV